MTPALIQAIESLNERENDYNILLARIQENQREYAEVQTFCNNVLPEPAATMRRTYFTGKATELTGKDADLKSQAEKLAESVRQLQVEIQRLRMTGG